MIVWGNLILWIWCWFLYGSHYTVNLYMPYYNVSRISSIYDNCTQVLTYGQQFQDFYEMMADVCSFVWFGCLFWLFVCLFVCLHSNISCRSLMFWTKIDYNKQILYSRAYPINEEFIVNIQLTIKTCSVKSSFWTFY